MSIRTTSFFLFAAVVLGCDESPEEVDFLARGDSLEIPGEWVIPPGDPLYHQTAGFAKILCSNVFLSGLDPEFAAQHTGYFTSPLEARSQVTDTVVDYEAKRVHLTLPDGTVRSAKLHGDQGCVSLPVGETDPYYEAVEVTPNLPDAETTPWPLGDLLSREPFPNELDMEIVAQAVDAAFEPEDAMTAAFVVTHRGRIVGERYRPGITHSTPLESWSMGKSLTGTLMGILIEKEVYELWSRAPVPEWEELTGDDPRSRIRIGDIMRMSSGLRFRAPQDPDFDSAVGYADHHYVYTGTVNSFEWAVDKESQWPPNTVGRYRNSDPVIANYLVRLGVESLGENYHEFPQRHLFDKLGIRNIIAETDPYGNFLLQGYEFGSGRDWARLGNLYLQDGQTYRQHRDGSVDTLRILPEQYVLYASTLAPAWEADGRAQYGGSFFWVNKACQFPVPEDAFFMAGAGGQYTIIIPSRELVVVRLGHYSGATDNRAREALNNALELLMEAVPQLFTPLNEDRCVAA